MARRGKNAARLWEARRGEARRGRCDSLAVLWHEYLQISYTCKLQLTASIFYTARAFQIYIKCLFNPNERTRLITTVVCVRILARSYAKRFQSWLYISNFSLSRSLLILYRADNFLRGVAIFANWDIPQINRVYKYSPALLPSPSPVSRNEIRDWAENSRRTYNPERTVFPL